MKIKANIFYDAIKKASVDGKIQDLKIVCDDDGVKMTHIDSAHVVLSDVFMDKKHFQEYEQCVISVKSTLTFLAALKQFGNGLIQINVADNMCKIQDADGGFDFSIAEEVSCAFDLKSSKLGELQFKSRILLTTDKLESVIKKNAVIKSQYVSIVNQDHKISFMLDNQSDKAHTTINSEQAELLKSRVNMEYFSGVLGVLTSLFSLKLGDGLPILIEETNDLVTTKYFISPVKDEDNA